MTGVEALVPLVPGLKGPVIELPQAVRAQLEDLQLEGDLLEVTLDQTQTIHRVLQAASQPPRHTLHTLILIELQEQRSAGHGCRNKDSRRKRKSQRAAGGEEGSNGSPPSQDGSESKKTRPLSDTPPKNLLQTHPEIL